MQQFDVKEHSHKRLNILTGEWILVSPHRTKRPWQGKVEAALNHERLEYDAACYLCPRNIRSGNEVNPDYHEPFAYKRKLKA